MTEPASPFLKSIKRIVILIIALAIGLFLGGYLTYKNMRHQKPVVSEKQIPKTPIRMGVPD